ncbi:DUF1565 domain-containing protein, partial [bacterium]|nr:DUF1565 domain-containing protein [candidate division CSSED10-310 bacterium]
STPLFDMVEFMDNTAVMGGAIAAAGGSGPRITRCTFIDNRAARGGAIAAAGDAIPVIGGPAGFGNTFGDNLAPAGADLFCTTIPASTITCTNNQFDGLPDSDYYISPQEAFDTTGSTGAVTPVTQDVYISPTGDDANTGLTPGAPFRTLRHAMERLLGTAGAPLTVHLAPGTYSTDTTGETFPLPLLPYVDISGADQDDSILDAASSGSLFHACHDHNLTVSHVTITGGHDLNGGGIYCGYGSDCVFDACLFTGNQADENGGGAYCDTGTTGHFTNCGFTANTAIYGGGLYSTRAAITCQNNSFTGNTAQYGGGAYCSADTGGFDTCSFDDNEAETGGGVQTMNDACSFISCTFENNLAASSGGAYYGNGSSNEFAYCTMLDNQAATGGGMMLKQCSGTFASGEISRSQAETGGAVAAIRSDTTEFHVCDILDNLADYGAIAHLDGTDTSFFDCLIEGNETSFTGGILCARFAVPRLDGTVFSANRARLGGAVYCGDSSEPRLARCRFEGNAAEMGGAVACSVDTLPHIGGTVEDRNHFQDNSAATGADLFCESPRSWPVRCTYNSFAGHFLSDYYISPIDAFDTTECFSTGQFVTQDVWVSPTGDDNNTGLSANQPWQSILYAMRNVLGTADNPVTIHLMSGSPADNRFAVGNQAPLPLVSHVSIAGEPLISRDPTIVIDAEHNGSCFYGFWDDDLTISNIQLINGDCTEGGGMVLKHSSPNIVGCLFQDCRAAYGGALSCCYSDPLLLSCKFKYNEALETGGAIDCHYSSPALMNCLLSCNQAGGTGGAVQFMDYSNPVLRYCSLLANNAGMEGGAISCRWAVTALLSGCIAYFNEPDQISVEGADMEISYSDIEDGWPGMANLAADPLFIDLPDCETVLRDDPPAGRSPCLDAGPEPADEVIVRTGDITVRLERLVAGMDRDRGATDLGFHHTPPHVEAQWVELYLPARWFAAGDLFLLEAVIGGVEPLAGQPLAVVMDVFGEYYWYPGWTAGFTWETVAVHTGESVYRLLRFNWPGGVGDADGIWFYGALLTSDRSALLGEWDAIRFGWRE